MEDTYQQKVIFTVDRVLQY